MIRNRPNRRRLITQARVSALRRSRGESLLTGTGTGGRSSAHYREPLPGPIAAPCRAAAPNRAGPIIARLATRTPMHPMPADASRTADFAAVRELAAADMQRVDALIRARLASDVVLINQIADHIVAGGGKRLRPMLHVLAAGAARSEERRVGKECRCRW